MRVDFHTHSTASDGTLTPAALAAAGEKAGLIAMALTDHDNCSGVSRFMSRVSCLTSHVLETREGQETRDKRRGWAGRETRDVRGGGGRETGDMRRGWVGHETGDMRRVAGIELSIEAGPDFDKFHLLGLGIDPTYPALKEFLKKVLEGRNARNARIIENFNRLGFGMGDEIFGYANGDVLARPHFANWLVERGHAATVAEAFDKYLLPNSPKETRCYEERYHPPQEESFGLIHAAGGLCVLAHPKYGRKEWRETGPDFAVAERALAALKEKGLDGVEAFYQANTVDENIAFTRIADRLGLLKTAGSDFHGATKPTVTLGMEVSEAFIAPFMEQVGCRG